MSNMVDVSHSRDYYKGKSVEFSGTWTPSMRYFNDEFVTSIVVYCTLDEDGFVINSALLGCKKTHVAKKNGSIINRTDNEPRFILKDGVVVGIEPNEYWIFICGSLQGAPGKSATIVNTYTDALALALDHNTGMLIYVKDKKEMYTVTGSGKLQQVVIGTEVQELWEKKVDKEDGKGLSTEDYTPEEKEKLGTVEEGAQVNIIEKIKFNGNELAVKDKEVDIEFKSNVYTIDKLATPDGDYFASYILRENGVRAGATINIPKGKSVQSGTVETVVRSGYPYTGANIGDKYIDLMLNDTAKTHVYIPANKLVDAYTGDKYVKVDADQKTVKFDYEQLKDDLQKEIKIAPANVNGLAKRLETLEDPKSKVVTIGTPSRRLFGDVVLDNRDFNIDPISNSISLNFNSADFDTSGTADRVREALLGKKQDVLDYDPESSTGLSLYGVKNALISIKSASLTKDNIGPGLTWSEDDKIVLHTKEGSSVQVNSNGEVILVWK